MDQAQSRTRPNRSDAQAQGQGSADEGAAGTRLYVGNLLYTAQRADIEELFAERGFTVAGVSISVDPFTGRNPSYCFVDLDSPEEAQRAIADLNGVDVRGRALRVSPGVAKRGSAQGQGQGQGQPASGGREVRVKNFERGWKGESREERSKWHDLLISDLADSLTLQTPNTSHPTTDGAAQRRLRTSRLSKPPKAKAAACT